MLQLLKLAVVVEAAFLDHKIAADHAVHGNHAARGFLESVGGATFGGVGNS